MVSITIPIEEELLGRINEFSWVNWSELTKEELRKKEIFDVYIETGELSDENWKFCEEIDWHPVDELPLKEEFIKRLEAAKKEKSIKLKSISEIFK